MTLSRIITDNYLTIRIFIGGVSVASNDSDVVASKRVPLKYVAKRLFITQITKISTCKISKKFDIERQKPPIFSKQHQKKFQIVTTNILTTNAELAMCHYFETHKHLVDR